MDEELGHNNGRINPPSNLKRLLQEAIFERSLHLNSESSMTEPIPEIMRGNQFMNNVNKIPNHYQLLTPIIRQRSNSLPPGGTRLGKDVKKEVQDDDRGWLLCHACDNGEFSARCIICMDKSDINFDMTELALLKIVCKTTIQNRIARQLSLLHLDPGMNSTIAARYTLYEIKMGRPTPISSRAWLKGGKITFYVNNTLDR